MEPNNPWGKQTADEYSKQYWLSKDVGMMQASRRIILLVTPLVIVDMTFAATPVMVATSVLARHRCVMHMRCIIVFFGSCELRDGCAKQYWLSRTVS